MDKASFINKIIPMDLFIKDPLQIDLVYANDTHKENIFLQALYHPAARLSLHSDLARIVISVARSLHDKYGYILLLKDGLRTVEAQKVMGKTSIVQKNPQWLEEPNRLISPPGAGGHPRGMAIDVSLLNHHGTPIDMGTVFDEMTPQSARAYSELNEDILHNRAILEKSFMDVAEKLNLPMDPLASEWWDFRFPYNYYKDYLPLSDEDLPPPLRMVAPQQEYHCEEWGERFDNHAKLVLNSL